MKPSVLLLTVSVSLPSLAQSELPQQLEPVVVSAQRSREAAFDAPAAISAVGRASSCW